MLNRKNMLLPMVVWILASPVAHYAGERKYTIGTGMNFTGSSGSRTQAAGPGLSLTTDVFRNYAAYPTIRMMSQGEHTGFETTYGFGYDRNRADFSRDSKSHAAAAKFTAELSPKWNLSLSEAFDKTADSTSFDAVRGAVVDPEEFHYLFSPVGTLTSSQTSTFNVGMTYASSKRSSLSMAGSYSMRSYAANQLVNGQLTGQGRTSGNMTYNRKTSERTSWSLSYNGAHYAFDAFSSSRSHAVSIGYSRQLTPTVAVQFAGGPSYVEGSDSNYSGYNTAVGFQKVIKPVTLSVRYAHDSGVATGLGAVSDTDQAGFTFARQFGRKVTVSADISAYRSGGGLDSLNAVSGATAATSVGLSLNRTVSLSWGGQYQRQDQSSLFAFEDKRFFVSIRFERPDFWSFTR